VNGSNTISFESKDTDWKIVKGSDADAPPPGLGVFTATSAEPPEIKRLASTVAESWLAFAKVVGKFIPFQFTTEAPEKFDPFTVRVRVDVPAKADWGARDDSNGTGLYAVPVTEVAELVVLLVMSGSGCVALTVALSASVPDKVGRRTNATVATAPLVRLPRLQCTTGLPPQLPWLGLVETKVAPDEDVFVSITFDAVLGPLLFTVIVIDTFAAVADVVGADSETATSAGLALRSRTRALRSM